MSLLNKYLKKKKKKGTNDEIIWGEGPGVFQEKSGDQHGWSRVTKGETCGREVRDILGGQVRGDLVGHG